MCYFGVVMLIYFEIGVFFVIVLFFGYYYFDCSCVIGCGCDVFEIVVCLMLVGLVLILLVSLLRFIGRSMFWLRLCVWWVRLMFIFLIRCCGSSRMIVSVWVLFCTLWCR